MTAPPRTEPTAPAGEAPRAGLRPGAPNRPGAPVWSDLYTWSDSQEEGRKRGRNARHLGLLLLAFAAVVTAVVAWRSGVREPRPRVYLDAAAFPLGTRIDRPELFTLAWQEGSDPGGSGKVRAIDYLDGEPPPPIDPADVSGQVLLMSGDEPLGILRGAANGLGAVSRVDMITPNGARVSLPVLSGWRLVWERGALFGVVPLRWILVAVAVLAVACWIPGLGPKVFEAWMTCVAAPLGWFNARVLLSVLFLVVFVPGGLFLRARRALLGLDPMGRDPAPDGYWRTRAGRSNKHFRRWF